MISAKASLSPKDSVFILLDGRKKKPTNGLVLQSICIKSLDLWCLLPQFRHLSYVFFVSVIHAAINPWWNV